MAELNFGRILRRGRHYLDAPAIVDVGTGHSATYAEHLERIERLCAVIGRLGVESDDRVGVLAGASHAYVELWQAALAGSAILNPLNTRLAPDELVYILNDSRTQVLFVDATHLRTIVEIRDRVESLRTVVLIDVAAPASETELPYDHTFTDLLSAATANGLPAEPDDEAPAVLMYTGGTTGLPKGVLLPQRAIALVTYRMQMGARYRPEGRYLAFMPMFHIGGIASWGLLVPTGGLSVIMPAFEPGAVNAAIKEYQISIIGAVPTMLAMMVEHEDFEPSMLASLEHVLYGAAPMPPELLDSLVSTYPSLSFFQAYGMTEFAATVSGLDPEDHRRGGEILRSVGRPCIGVDLEIRDPESAAPLEAGEVGEIWLRCDSVMIGYWNKPEQTASSLVDGWYRTGDAGWLDDHGYLFMADRIKDMIVSGAENVYSLEVENALSDHPAVQQVGVVGVPDPTWGERVHAVVVCAPGSVTEGELDEHARSRLAGYKVPKGWTFRTEPLPLSAAGKVLKRQLRDELASAESGDS